MFLAIISISLGCKKEDDKPADPGFLTCTVGGETFTAAAASCTIFLDKTTILGTDATGEQSIKLVLPLDLTLDVYEIGQSDSVGGVYQFSPSLLMYADSGNIEITDYDKGKGLIEGHFNFRAKSPGAGIFFQSYLTDGSFKVQH